MNMTEYMNHADRTAVHPLTIPEGAYPHLAGLLYCATKLCGESGEVAEVIGKALRDDGGRFPPERRRKLVLEMGDVFWYLARICKLMNINPEIVLQANLDKLSKRKEQGTLHGDGSDR